MTGNAKDGKAAIPVGLVLLAIIAATLFLLDSNWFVGQYAREAWHSRPDVRWILLFRPFSRTEVDAVRKALLAIESASEVEYRESFEPGTSFDTLLEQPTRGSFSEIGATLLESDGKTAVVHLSSVWIPSMELDSGKVGYIDENIHVVKGLAHIHVTEPIQIPIPIPSWFIAGSESHLPFDPLTEVQLTSAPRPSGRLAITSWDSRSRSIFERLGIGSRDGESTHILAVTLESPEIPVFKSSEYSEQQVSDYAPSWSPDGREIAFVRKEDTDRDGKLDENDIPQVFVMKSDGSSQARLTDLRGNKWGVTWSYDGTTLAFVVEDRLGDANPQAFTIDTDGTGLREITARFNKFTTPTWSPTRKEIAFSTADGDVEIFSLSDNQLTKMNLPPGPYGSPSWSPTGESVAVAPYPAQSLAQLIIYNLSKRSHRSLQPSCTGTARRPTWSPDGQSILFFTDHASYSDLWVISPGGSDLRRVTSGKFASVAVWSPDGRYIALSKWHDSDGDGLLTDQDDVDTFVFDVSSGGWIRLARPRTWESELSWTASAN